MSLLLLANLVDYSQETGDAISRLMRSMGPALHLPSADMELAALNATGTNYLMSQFRRSLERQLHAVDAYADSDFIVADDTHDMKRYSKKEFDAGKKKMSTPA